MERTSAATMQRASRVSKLAQLAVLAAAAVVARKMGGVPIFTLLARDAEAHAGHGDPARLGYCGATVRTLAERFSLRQATLGPTYPVRDGRVDLLVDRIISCPARGHVALLYEK